MKFTIYKIQSINNLATQIYIGITRDFRQRQYLHKSDFNNVNSPRYNLPIYNYIRNNGGWIFFNFEMLEDVELEDEKDKAIYEERYYNLYKNICLNKNVPNRTHRESVKNYYENNKAKILLKKKEQYKIKKMKNEIKKKFNKYLIKDV